MHIAHSLILEATRHALGGALLIVDRTAAVVPDGLGTVAAAVYVYNYVIPGHSKAKVDAAAAAVVLPLNAHRLPAHAVVEAKEGAEFVGLEIAARPVKVRIKKFRGWRLRLGLQGVLA